MALKVFVSAKSGVFVDREAAVLVARYFVPSRIDARLTAKKNNPEGKPSGF
ncbi:MAG: hypothetical protein H6684_12765 [Deltaproteobacteria bacterium]|nr:hypothetical protein [bacterium]MCB9475287.1 hypothetical protein [Deltaproteobacteria bacterium]MCB9489596.1 hypothetical protein [Deltaproteobacteria bacterium]